MALNFIPLTATGLDGSIIGVINTNFANLAVLLADAHSRSGVTPNQLTNQLDMNNFFIINLPLTPTNNAHAASKFYVDTQIGNAIAFISLNQINFPPFLTILNFPNAAWFINAGLSVGYPAIQPNVPPVGLITSTLGAVFGNPQPLLATGAIQPALQIHGTTTSNSSVTNARWSADATAPQNYLQKSRGAAVGTHATVLNQDNVGALLFIADDGTVFRNVARLGVLVDGAVSSGVVPGRFTIQLANAAGSLGQFLALTNLGTLQLGTVGGSAGFSNVLLEANFNTGQPQSPQGGVSHIRITAPDNGFGAFTSETFGTGFSFFTMRAAAGTQALPTALGSSAFVGAIAWYAFNGTVYNSTAQIQALTINTQTGSDSSGVLDFLTTPSGSTTQARAMRIQGSGGVSIGSTVDPGISALAVPTVYGGVATTSVLNLYGTTSGSPASGAAGRLSSSSINAGVFVDFQGKIGLNTVSPATQFHVHLTTNQNSIWVTGANTVLGGNAIGIWSMNDALNTFQPIQFSCTQFCVATGSTGGNVLDYNFTTTGFWAFNGSSGIQLPAGGASTPSLFWRSSTTTGLYSPAADWVALTQAGQFVAGLPGAQKFVIWQGFPLAFDSGGGTGDTGLSRTAAATLALGNGTAANATGTFLAASAVLALNLDPPTAGSMLAVENLATTNTVTKTVRLDFFGRDTVNTRKNIGAILVIPGNSNWTAADITVNTWNGTLNESTRFHTSGGVSIGSTTDPGASMLLLAGGIFMSIPAAFKTGTTYTVSATDSTIIINSGAAFTITLPTASSNTGRILFLQQKAAFTVASASSNVVPLTGTTAGTPILSGASKFAMLQSDGTNWQTIMAN